MKITIIGPAYPYRGGIALFSNRLADALVEEGHDVNSFEYYLWGSKEIVESLKEYVASKGVNADNMFFENFG